MQRGCVSTLAASTKRAGERCAGSEMVANADAGCNVLGGCAEAEVNPTMATQNSNAMASVRMRPHAPIEGNSSPEDSRRPRHFDCWIDAVFKMSDWPKSNIGTSAPLIYRS